MNNNYLIVVGVDGSDGGRRALDWAVREAGRRGGAVQAVSAWSWDGTQFGPIIATNPREAEEYARKIVDGEVAEMIRRHGSSVPVSGRVLEGRPADVLAEAARGADLLVLGSHGHSRVRQTVLGSTTEDTIRKATSPVVVIPVPVRKEAAPEPANA